MTDKEFWLTVRAALIMMVKAIEKRYMVISNVSVGDAPVIDKVTAS
jgi:hypothetical protein